MSFSGRSAGRWVAALALAAGISLTTVSAPACLAQDDLNGPIIVKSISLADADLQAAVNVVTRETGVDIIIEPGDYKPIRSLALTNKPLAEVLRFVCTAAGATVRVESGVYIISPKGPEPTATVDQTPANEPEVTVPKRMRVEKVRVVWSRPSAIKAFLEADADTTAANDFERMIYRSQLGALRSSGGLPTFNGPTQPSMVPMATERVPPVVPTSDNMRVPGGDESNQMRGGGGFGGGGFGGGGYGGGLQGGGLGGGLGGGGLQGGGLGGGGLGGGGLQGGGGASNLVPTDIQSILAYDVDNTLIVRGTPEAIRELRQIITLLDVAPRQLSIKADFIEARQDDIRTFGIDWSIARGSFSAGTGGTYATGDVFVNFATGNIVSALRTSLVEGRGRVVNSPMATTTNNVPVTISLNTSLPVITNQVVFGGTGSGVVVPQVTTVNVTSGLQVLPRINGDNSISMVVTPFISDIVSEVANPAGGTLPVFTQQSITVVRRIANDETMVIGGLIKKNDTSSVKKVPLLADIPLIGQFFRSTSHTINDSELLIFITPHIIPERSGATTGTAVIDEAGGGPVAP